eukprot:675860-Amphidinium_carterae.1
MAHVDSCCICRKVRPVVVCQHKCFGEMQSLVDCDLWACEHIAVYMKGVSRLAFAYANLLVDAAGGVDPLAQTCVRVGDMNAR